MEAVEVPPYYPYTLAKHQHIVRERLDPPGRNLQVEAAHEPASRPGADAAAQRPRSASGGLLDVYA